METRQSLPALREREPEPGLPSGGGIVHVVGGERLEGDVRLLIDWVVVDKHDDSRETVAVPLGRVLSVTFAP